MSVLLPHLVLFCAYAVFSPGRRLRAFKLKTVWVFLICNLKCVTEQPDLVSENGRRRYLVLQGRNDESPHPGGCREGHMVHTHHGVSPGRCAGGGGVERKANMISHILYIMNHTGFNSCSKRLDNLLNYF